MAQLGQLLVELGLGVDGVDLGVQAIERVERRRADACSRPSTRALALSVSLRSLTSLMRSSSWLSDGGELLGVALRLAAGPASPPGPRRRSAPCARAPPWPGCRRRHARRRSARSSHSRELLASASARAAAASPAPAPSAPPCAALRSCCSMSMMSCSISLPGSDILSMAELTFDETRREMQSRTPMPPLYVIAQANPTRRRGNVDGHGRRLARRLAAGRLHHAYLFEGPPGAGKAAARARWPCCSSARPHAAAGSAGRAEGRSRHAPRRGFGST